MFVVRIIFLNEVLGENVFKNNMGVSMEKKFYKKLCEISLEIKSEVKSTYLKIV